MQPRWCSANMRLQSPPLVEGSSNEGAARGRTCSSPNSGDSRLAVREGPRVRSELAARDSGVIVLERTGSMPATICTTCLTILPPSCGQRH